MVDRRYTFYLIEVRGYTTWRQTVDLMIISSQTHLLEAGAFHGTVTAVAVAGAWYGASAAASAAPTVASSALASKTGRVLQALLLSCSGRFAMLLLRGE